MKDLLALKHFLHDDQAVISTEYVVFVAFIAVVLAAGVGVLYVAMRDFFGDWAHFFGG
jgi:Flp pilus assembly pilin Flp